MGKYDVSWMQLKLTQGVTAEIVLSQQTQPQQRAEAGDRRPLPELCYDIKINKSADFITMTEISKQTNKQTVFNVWHRHSQVAQSPHFYSKITLICVQDLNPSSLFKALFVWSSAI